MPDRTLMSVPTPLDWWDVDLEMFVESFLQRWTGNTAVSYRDDVRMFLTWCARLGRGPFDLRRQHLELYAKYLREERGNAASTISHRLGTLNTFYEIALDDELVPKNPMRMVKLPKVRKDLHTKVSLDRSEMQAVAKHAHDSSFVDYALVVIMGYTGLRVSEVCSLDVEDVLSYSKGHRVMTFTQKGGEIVTVPQPAVVARAIDLVIGDRRSGPLLLRRDGTRMTRSSADRVVKRLAKKAGITGMAVSPHTFRHSFAVNSIDAGVPLRQVQLSMRHRDISTTIAIYDRGRANLDTHASHTLAAYLGAVA